jgi:NAD(P)-dependent dehydrogenase (short-subunit alcohol dehydrogenase family)
VLRLFAESGGPASAAITGLVNNAGIIQPQMRVRDMSCERLQRIMAVQRDRLDPLRPGGGAADVDASGGTAARSSTCPRLAARSRAPGEYRGLCRKQGHRSTTFTLGLALRGRRRRHPRQCRAARHHRDRHPRQRRDPRRVERIARPSR